MGTGHRDFSDFYKGKFTGANRIPALTSSGTLDLKGKDFFGVIFTDTLTATLPTAPFGVRGILGADDTSVVTIADAGGTIGVLTGTTGESAVEVVSMGGGNWTAITLLPRTAADALGATNLGSMYTTLTTTSYRIGIPVTAWREVSSGAVTNTAGGGGVLSSNTTPTVTPLNAGTDPTQIITWASSNNDVILAVVPLPADVLQTLGSPLVFGCSIKSGGTSNAVGFGVSIFSSGGTALADNATSGTNQTTSFATKTASADTSGGAWPSNFVTVMLTPAAHTTDTMVMKDAWLTVTKVLVAS